MGASWLGVTALFVLFHSGWSWLPPFRSAPRVWVASPRKLHERTPPAYRTPSLFSRWTDSMEETNSDSGLGTYSDVRSALWELCDEDAVIFEEHHLALLHKARYRDFAELLKASREGLDSIGLPAALVDIIIAGQEGFSSPECRKGVLGRFAQALQQRSIERVKVSDTCDAAYLPNGVKWPGLDSNVLHVRHFFDDFLESVLCRFVLITSPRTSRWHGYRKSHSKMVYLPVYGKEEILDLRQVCFPHLDIAGVAARYGRWGGIPRSVLLKADPAEQARIERKIKALGYERALLLLDGEEAAEWHDYEVHIKVKGEFPGGAGPDNVTFYELHGWDFGSTYIKDAIFRSISNYERRALRAQIRSGKYVFQRQRVAAGHELELELRLQLITGGQFTVRRVADGKVEVRTLPPLKEVHFASGGLSNVFRAGSDELYVSDDPNESAADMIVARDNMIIQLTLKREHNVVLTARGAAEASAKPSTTKGLGALVDSMRLVDDIDIYWAVPDTALEEYAPEFRYF